MNCQTIELVGRICVAPAMLADCALPTNTPDDGTAIVQTIGKLLDIFTGTLLAEELLLGAAQDHPAAAARDLIEALRASLRQAIEVALAVPAGVGDRMKLLGYAIDFDGCGGPLAARAAGALADAVSAAAARLSVGGQAGGTDRRESPT